MISLVDRDRDGQKNTENEFLNVLLKLSICILFYYLFDSQKPFGCG